MHTICRCYSPVAWLLLPVKLLPTDAPRDRKKCKFDSTISTEQTRNEFFFFSVWKSSLIPLLLLHITKWSCYPALSFRMYAYLPLVAYVCVCGVRVSESEQRKKRRADRKWWWNGMKAWTMIIIICNSVM